MKEISNIPMRETNPHDAYLAGVDYGKYQIEKIIESKLQNLEKARDWSADLSYPYPEVHAIWKGEEQACKKLLDELNPENKPKTTEGKILARQCINFMGLDCNNKDCINDSCPLNKLNSQIKHFKKKYTSQSNY